MLWRARVNPDTCAVYLCRPIKLPEHISSIKSGQSNLAQLIISRLAPSCSMHLLTGYQILHRRFILQVNISKIHCVALASAPEPFLDVLLREVQDHNPQRTLPDIGEQPENVFAQICTVGSVASGLPQLFEVCEFRDAQSLEVGR